MDLLADPSSRDDADDWTEVVRNTGACCADSASFGTNEEEISREAALLNVVIRRGVATGTWMRAQVQRLIEWWSGQVPIVAVSGP
jgi:hypothetical protein